MKKTELIDSYSRLLHLKHYSPTTEKAYLYYLNVFLDYIATLSFSSVDSKVLTNYFDHLKRTRNCSCSAIKQAHASVRFLFLDVLQKEIDFDFFSMIKKPDSLPDVLTVEEVKKIISSISNLKHRTTISTIYSCGLRTSECTNLRISDIDLSAMTIKIFNEKGKNNRTVMLSQKLLPLLHEYFKKYKPKVYLFEGTNGAKYSERSIQQIFKDACKKGGIEKKVAVHSLRHSFASHLLDTGTDIRCIQQLLGHKHLSTTQIYTRVKPISVEKIRSPFDNI